MTALIGLFIFLLGRAFVAACTDEIDVETCAIQLRAASYGERGKQEVVRGTFHDRRHTERDILTKEGATTHAVDETWTGQNTSHRVEGRTRLEDNSSDAAEDGARVRPANAKLGGRVGDTVEDERTMRANSFLLATTDYAGNWPRYSWNQWSLAYSDRESGCGDLVCLRWDHQEGAPNGLEIAGYVANDFRHARYLVLAPILLKFRAWCHGNKGDAARPGSGWSADTLLWTTGGVHAGSGPTDSWTEVHLGAGDTFVFRDRWCAPEVEIFRVDGLLLATTTSGGGWPRQAGGDGWSQPFPKWQSMRWSRRLLRTPRSCSPEVEIFKADDLLLATTTRGGGWPQKRSDEWSQPYPSWDTGCGVYSCLQWNASAEAPHGLEVAGYVVDDFQHARYRALVPIVLKFRAWCPGNHSDSTRPGTGWSRMTFLRASRGVHTGSGPTDSWTQLHLAAGDTFAFQDKGCSPEVEIYRNAAAAS